ncbi:cryptochrome/photolyase family protein [Agaribacter flavus]|uniref:Cryptochrome/photolyase family protein n=1 Tax=Agaribacter flavus TaxID=1902781 RepID=A0ABV7FQX2_9ALTE
MAKLCLILGDQLSLDTSSLQKIDRNKDWVLMAEVREEASYVKHHKKKIAFIFSAMRHFAEKLKSAGYQVNYVEYQDKHNKGSLFEQLKVFASSHALDEIVIAHPAEYRLWEAVTKWEKRLKIKVTITEDLRFVADNGEFKRWAKGRKQLRMEYFYREMRKKYNVLIEKEGKGAQPTAGKWNYDSENRQALPKNTSIPLPTQFAPDDITQGVIDLVATEFSHHFGELANFHYAVDREQALLVLNEFIDERLPRFGQYQDAMSQNEPWLYHSHLGLYINTGLLSPMEVIRAAEQAYEDNKAPLNSVEGFIRQILGWREYVRGFYWYLMPDYKDENYFHATRTLPSFFWSAKTDMNCLAQCISDTKANAYAHHIQRLMVIGNFALLTGLSPEAVNEWYLLVYADAYEWVELPNVSGMVLFADGGKLASKPYAASGAYINKMSNYCQHCSYSVKHKTGSQACPFNYLYWHFLIKHKDKLSNNPRMAMIYRTLQKMDEKHVQTMLDDADIFLAKLDNNEEV